MKNKKDKISDYSNIKRYSMMDKTWYEETYREIGECSYGEYVLYKDYMKLLDEKAPARSADLTDIGKLIVGKIKELEDLCDSTFLKKDEINYGWAVSCREEANLLLRTAHILGIELDDE